MRIVRPEFRAEFQSTRPRGARRSQARQKTSMRRGFNPRAREGRDVRKHALSLIIKRFQSTRPRGARRVCRGDAGRVQPVSIHAPARGATRATSIRWPLTRVSIHAPARGATLTAELGGDRRVFQSTRPRGARPGSRLLEAVCRRFNPRAREGRDRRTAPI